MIKKEEELIRKMRKDNLIVFVSFDYITSNTIIWLQDYDGNDVIDDVSSVLLHSLVKRGILKAKDASRCLDVDNTVFYLPEQEPDIKKWLPL